MTIPNHYFCVMNLALVQLITVLITSMVMRLCGQ